MRKEGQDIKLVFGLEHIDEDVEKLLNLWQELQSSSAEVAISPSPHMFGFFETALLFAVIYELPKILPDTESPSSGSKGKHAPIKQVGFTPAPSDGLLFPSLVNPKEEEDWSDDPWGDEDGVFEDKYTGIAHNSWNQAPTSSLPPSPQKPVAIGVVYVTSSHLSNVPAGEVNLGIILHRDARGRGYARQTLELVLPWVFEEVKFHRLQAALMDSPQKDKAMTLFTQMGFNHEGTRRRSVFCPEDCCWKDVTYFAMLDTDYLNRAYIKPAPKSLWDELFLRHQREREELLRWEERNSHAMKRTTSMETIRLATEIADLPMDKTDHEESSDVESAGRSRRVSVAASSTSSRSSFSDIQIPFIPSATPFLGRGPSPGPSSYSSSPSPAPSDSSSSFAGSEPPRSPSPDESPWDLVETSSVSTRSSCSSFSDIE